MNRLNSVLSLHSKILKKNIILDLDSTLLFSVPVRMVSITHLESAYGLDNLLFHTAKGMDMVAIKRPHLDRFIGVCCDVFDKVMVWSVSDANRIKTLVDAIFGTKKCDGMLSHTDTVFIAKGDFHKPLYRAQEKFPSYNLTQANTIYVDDYECNFRTTDHTQVTPCYGIAVYPFGRMERGFIAEYPDKDDNELDFLINIFTDLVFLECEDVQEIFIQEDDEDVDT